jgi:arylsulfatase
VNRRIHEPGFAGVIGRTVAESAPWSPPPPRPPAGAPNVVVIVLDDVGFAQFGCFGSTIRTPALDRLAAEGTRYANFHVTPLCSPTRACLLSGRNHHSVGMGMLAGFPNGFPNGRESVTHHAAMLPAVLRERGYGTYAVGKWHLAPMRSVGPAGPFDHWPTAHGFDRFYGFLGGETDQYRPNLVSDQQVVVPPDNLGYHLSEDLVDRALGMLRAHRSGVDVRPFMLYLAFGACHGPHQSPAAYRERYRGAFDAGWDQARADWFARQLETGVVPPGTRLTPGNPGVPAWADLDEPQRRLYARYQEAFAGFLEHTDAQVSRLLAGLEALGCLDDTIVVALSDNGASGEAGARGTWNELIALNDFPEVVDRSGEHADALGDRSTYPLYPAGWAQAGNTPGKWFKHHTFGGGVRAPLIVRWPGHTGDRGRVDHRFCHAVDIVPTLLDAIGLEAPSEHAGRTQMPLHGAPIDLSAASPPAPRTQYFEMGGHRGIFHEGWKAVTMHEAGADFDDDVWELYHLDVDFSESTDVAARHPEVLADLVERWWAEAAAHDVLPLDDRFTERAANATPVSVITLHRGTPRIAEAAFPSLSRRAWHLDTELGGLGEDPAGVVVSYGGRFGGMVLYVAASTLCLDVNYFGELAEVARVRLPQSDVAAISMTFTPQGSGARVRMQADGAPPVEATVAAVVPYYSGGNGVEVGAAPLSAVSTHPAAAIPFAGELAAVRFRFAPAAVDPGGVAAWLAAD